MPNWCEGTIKFRGKREDIIRAITEGLQPCDGAKGTEKIVFVFEEEYSEHVYDSLGFEAVGDTTFWLDGTHRHFVEVDDCAITANRFDAEFIIAIPFRAAWGIKAKTTPDCDGLDNFAKKYHVDVRASGFEMGMGFKQTVEVNRKGEVLVDYIEDYGHNYRRFVWECEMPLLGG